MNDEKIIKDAQYRKGLSIAFFNATNNATEIVKMIYQEHPQSANEQIIKDISFWRDWLLEEHKTYYATVIANIGANYKAEDSIAKLKKTKTLEELRTAWLQLSEDERRDGDIKKVANELKKKYEETSN